MNKNYVLIFFFIIITYSNDKILNFGGFISNQQQLMTCLGDYASNIEFL